jgi:hypothetical protein
MSLIFKGVEEGGYGGYSLTDQLLYNLKGWIDWALLHHGAYNIYTLSQDSYFANDESVLYPVPDGRLPDRTVYNGVGREWVWETDAIVPSGAAEPFRVSGVYVNDNFVSSGSTGISRFHTDYRNGRIIFDQSQGVDDVISANYTSRGVYVGMADSEEFNLLMLDSVEEFLTNDVPSGTPSKDHQVWLPSVFLELDSGTGRGLALGGGQIKTRIITLHIFADSAGDRNLLMDWLDFQNRANFWMADLNAITLPFNEYGDVVPGTTNWADLTISHPWKKLRIMDGSVKRINSLNTKLFRATVRYKVEIDVGSI